MKNLLLLVALLPSLAFADDLQKSDQLLNENYKKAISNLDRSDATYLKKSQIDWLKFRNSQCTFTSGNYGVTTKDAFSDFNQCISEFNYNRSKFLENIGD